MRRSGHANERENEREIRLEHAAERERGEGEGERSGSAVTKTDADTHEGKEDGRQGGKETERQGRFIVSATETILGTRAGRSDGDRRTHARGRERGGRRIGSGVRATLRSPRRHEAGVASEP